MDILLNSFLNTFSLLPREGYFGRDRTCLFDIIEDITSFAFFSLGLEVAYSKTLPICLRFCS